MSMGGMICQIAAGRYPHRVLSLTSMMSNTGVVSKGKSALMVSIQMLKKPAKGQSSLDHSVETLQIIGSPGYPIADSTVRAMLTAEYRRSSYPAGYWRQMAAINTSGNRVALLRSLRMPVLVIHGLQDRLVSVDGGIDTAKHVANANLQIFPGMGHNLPHELLSTFADLILDNAGAVQR
jgi:pimeloyl-ACP methyl ester carboxylesterase